MLQQRIMERKPEVSGLAFVTCFKIGFIMSKKQIQFSITTDAAKRATLKGKENEKWNEILIVDDKKRSLKRNIVGRSTSCYAWGSSTDSHNSRASN